MNRWDDKAATDSGWFGCETQTGSLAIIEVPFDATSSHHRVAAGAPEAIRVASHQVELTLLDGRCPAQAGLVVSRLDLRALNDHAHAAMTELRAGANEAAKTVEEAASQAEQALRESLLEHWREQRQTLVIGGDHGSTFAAMDSAKVNHPSLGILQIDAHADLRADYEGVECSHASVMRRLKLKHPSLRLVQVGLRDLGQSERELIDSDPEIIAFFDEALAQQEFLGMPWAEQARAIIESLPEKVWISLDIDGLDPSLCPHTGTPVPGGLSYHRAVDLIDRIHSSGRTLVGADLSEVAGHPFDALVAARLAYRLLAGLLDSKK